MEIQPINSNLVTILDYGSQYTQLITRQIKILSVFSLCISLNSSLKSITELNPSEIILSGAPYSVHMTDSPCFIDVFMEYVEKNKVFVLGIYYGLQLIMQKLGGEVAIREKQEYGRMVIEVVKGSCGLFGGKKVGDKQVVWMSHRDEMVKLPVGFEVVVRSEQGGITTVENSVR